MAGIGQPPAPRRLWWGPVFATAAVAVTIALWPRSQAPALPALPSLVAESAPIALDAASLTNEAAAPSTTRSGSAGARRVNVSDAMPSAEELEFRARAIAALDRPAPLAVEAIQPQPLSIPLLVIAPLSSTAATAGGDGGK